jgi:C4-dicarboxylate transporter, DctQ subunit
MFKLLDKIITWFENTLIVTGLLSVALVLFLNVILRYVFKLGVVWAEEYVRYVMIWMVMAGSGAAVREKKHMSITALIDLTKNRTLHFIINMFVLIVSILFSLFLVYSGVRLTGSMISNNQLSAALEIPLWWVYISLPIGGLLMLIRFIQSFFEQLKDFKHESQEVPAQ